jgi:hypothetical protein
MRQILTRELGRPGTTKEVHALPLPLAGEVNERGTVAL